MKRILDLYCQVLKVLMTGLMMVTLLPVTMQVLSRRVDWIPRYIWTEEVARFCFVWIIMLGSMVAVREGKHFSVDLMPEAKNRREEGVSRLIVHLAMLVMAGVFVWYGWQFAGLGAIQVSEMSGINMLSIYASFPLAGATWVVFLAERICQDVSMIREPPASDQA